jgi:hypothetical protein
MRRSFWILCGVLLASVAMAVASYRLAGRVSAAALASPTDDLEWLRLEFHLTDADLGRIRALHDGYRPECERYCAEIAARKRTLAAALESGAAPVPPAAEQLAEIAAVRAQCQAAMLHHFEAVSREMPPKQGAHYLAVMRQLTLGRHDEVETSMANADNSSHGHHH